jgi:CRISPR-associated protein Csd1
MILHRLYELAERQRLLEDPAFEELPVPYVVQLKGNGEFLGIEERRNTITIPATKKGAPPKTEEDKGKVCLVPKAHGNTANSGFARFFVDTLPRALAISDDTKSTKSRKTFWEQIDQAAEATDDPGLRAVQAFGRQMLADADLRGRLRARLEALKPDAGDRCTFACFEDGGSTILEREPVRAWYRQFYTGVQAQRQEAGAQGLCQITREFGPLARSHTTTVSGIPGGIAKGVSLVSNDKAAFESYGLDGAVNASISPRAAEGYARALSALIHKNDETSRLCPGHRTCYRVASTLFVFWTRQPQDLDDLTALFDPRPEQVQHLLESVQRGQESHGVEPEKYYCLCVSGNSARAIVREYLETPLPLLRDNLAHWFEDLTIASATKEGGGKPWNLFPLWQLVGATALEIAQVSPDVPARLMHAALKGEPVSDSLLAACLGRLRAEGSSAFRPARMALIKITLLRRNVPVTVSINPDETNPAYVCGQLLAVFEQIQYAALGDVNATVTDKFFGTFSCAPAVLLGRLYAGAQNHLRKLRGEKPGAYVALDKLLTEVTGKLKAPPSRPLSLEEQGRFALGYYHEKARQFEERAQRKAAKASTNEQ